MSSSNRPFVCSLCSQTFTRNENLERHKRSRHSNAPRKPFECPHCRASFSRRDVCKRHTERCQIQSTGPVVRRVPSESHGCVAGDVDAITPPDPSGVLFNTYDSPSNRAANTWPVPVSTDSGMDWAGSTSSASPCNDDIHIAAYNQHFHPSFPLIHWTTIQQSAPGPLRDIIVAIGSLYAAHSLPEREATSCASRSQTLWNTGQRELQHLVSADWRELRKTATIQAWLLHIIYGAFMGDAAQYSTAKKMLRSLVDAAQDLGLLRQASVVHTPSQAWIRPSDGEDGKSLHGRWMLYVDEESLRLSMYAMLFLDFHIFSPCNVRSLMSPMELDWELPLPASLWEAESALGWLEALNEEAQVNERLQADDSGGFHCPTTRSLTLAMQSLMSPSPSPSLMATLAASPLATLFVLTNVDSFVRDLTRSYYQFPPNLSDPSAFHILTQSQNRQVAAALRQITNTVASGRQRRPDSDGCIWASVERVALAVAMSLSQPDELLIGGIVDSSVVAGLATATHLSLGLYAGARRSLQSLLQHSAGDDAVRVILDDAVGMLTSIRQSSDEEILREAPWTTVATYRILLAVWRSLRRAAGEMRERSGQMMRRFEAPTVVFNAITEAVLPQQHGQDQEATGILIVPPDVSEVHFTKAILEFWKQRSVWAIGPSMATVLDEIIAAGY